MPRRTTTGTPPPQRRPVTDATAHVLAYSIDDARRRPIPPPNQGMADTLEEAQAAFKKRYEEVKRGK